MPALDLANEFHFFPVSCRITGMIKTTHAIRKFHVNSDIHWANTVTHILFGMTCQTSNASIDIYIVEFIQV